MSPRDSRSQSEQGSEDSHGSRSTKRQRRDDAAVFDSDLTDEKRRELRKELRNLTDVIDASTTLEDVRSARRESNKLFKNVKFTREAVLDAENIDLIVAKTNACAEALVQVPRYDAVKILRKLRSSLTKGSRGGNEVDWLLLGRECCICYNAVNDNISFLAGPLDVTVTHKQKARKPRETVTTANVKEEEPDEIVEKQQNVDMDSLGAADKTIKMTKKKLKDRFKENEHNDLPGVQFLFNPKSFTQTVENIFSFSFLVKRGEGMIKIAEPRLDQSASRLMVAPTSAPQQATVPKQSVCKFTMRDWERLCKGMGTVGDMPHRATKQQHHKAAK